MKDQPDSFGVFRLVFPQDLLGVVCRSVIADQDLHRKAGFLREDAVETLADELFVIVGHNKS